MVLGVIGLASPANADEADSVFKPSQLISVDISSSLGSPKLTRHYLNFEGYRRANLKISMPGTRHYVTLMNVGVHQKGSYTRRYEKVSLKIKLDAFVPGQSFLGLTRLTLNAMMQDPSMVHEVTAYQLYRAVGVPAPRTGYAKVRLDGRYMGLYLNLETVDSKMLSRWFNSTKHVYSGPQFCDLVPGNSCEVASVGDTDRADLITASQLSQLNGKAWWNKFSKLANVTEVLRLMATDVFLSNWDGYTDYSQNNHFIHFDKKGRFSILPWGTDQTFPSRSNYQLSWDGSTSPGKTKGYKQSTLFTH
jgi:spore coat protein CotH